MPLLFLGGIYMIDIVEQFVIAFIQLLVPFAGIRFLLDFTRDLLFKG